jgi:hypothetical protein
MNYQTIKSKTFVQCKGCHLFLEIPPPYNKCTSPSSVAVVRYSEYVSYHITNDGNPVPANFTACCRSNITQRSMPQTGYTAKVITCIVE